MSRRGKGVKMFTVSCVYGFARGRTAFIFFNTARRRIPLLVLLTAMNWIKRASTSTTPLLLPAQPSPAPVHGYVLQQKEPSSPKHDPKCLNQWQTSNKPKTGEWIKPTGWSWTGNPPTGGNHHFLWFPHHSGNKEHRATALHCITAGIPGFLLQNYFMLFPAQTPPKSLMLSQSTTSDKVGNAKSVCPPPSPSKYYYPHMILSSGTRQKN